MEAPTTSSTMLTRPEPVKPSHFMALKPTV